MAVLNTTDKNITHLNILSFFELKELPRLLLPGEQVKGAISGFYEMGPATLCVTNERMLLIDKKFIRMCIEDIRFDSLGEIQYSQQLFLSSVKLVFAGQQITFKTLYMKELRAFIQYVQLRTLQENAEESNPIHAVSKNTFTEQPTPGAPAAAAVQNEEVTMYQRFQKWRKVTEYIGALQLVRRGETL